MVPDVCRPLIVPSHKSARCSTVDAGNATTPSANTSIRLANISIRSVDAFIQLRCVAQLDRRVSMCTKPSAKCPPWVLTVTFDRAAGSLQGEANAIRVGYPAHMRARDVCPGQQAMSSGVVRLNCDRPFEIGQHRQQSPGLRQLNLVFRPQNIRKRFSAETR